MDSLRGSKTAQNLLDAFRNKTYDQQKYTNCGAVAVEQGYMEISRLFDFMAGAVNEHSRLVARFLLCSGYTSDEICAMAKKRIKAGDTIANLEWTAKNQAQNALEIYQGYTQTAYDEKYLEVAIMFNMIAKADENMGELCAQNVAMLINDTYYNKKEVKKWLCNRCGYVFNGYSAPEICPLCNMNRNYFQVQETII